MLWPVVAALGVWQLAGVQGSAGDKSWVYGKCMQQCVEKNCSSSHALRSFMVTQPSMERLLGWSCREECGYLCMWKTVDAYQRDGSKVPQFHGKWPFIRVLGVQEPASVIFSILNGVTNMMGLLHLRRMLPAKAPMYHIWQLSALIAINGWIWATIFHSRDTPFTEAMDYIGCTATVAAMVLMLIARVLVFQSVWKLTCCATVLLSAFMYHVHYIIFVHMDYGYNLKVMAATGLVNSSGWLVWCLLHRRLPHVWKAAVTITSLTALVSLEIGDFPPFLWTIDAHSLWHLGTFPFPLLWFSFAVDDSLYLLKTMKENNKKAKEDLLENASEEKTEEKKIL